MPVEAPSESIISHSSKPEPLGPWRSLSTTDALSKQADSQRIMVYAEVLAKESRKALTAEFNEKHKGMPFNTTPSLLRDSLLAWFARRDKTLRVTSETAAAGTLGEVRASFRCNAKNMSFKILAHAKFTLSGGSAVSPCYLKELNVTVAS